MRNSLPGLGLLQRPLERSQRLGVAEDLDGLHESLELVHAQQDGSWNSIARNGDDLVSQFDIPNQVKEFIPGLRDRDVLIYLRHADFYPV